MVSIIPAERTGFDAYAKQLSAALGPTLTQAFERNRTQQVLTSLQGQMEQAKDDPLKLAMLFAQAGAAAPGLERALGPLYQTAMNQSNAKGAGNALAEGVGGGGQPGTSLQPNGAQIGPESAATQPPQPISAPDVSGKAPGPDIQAIANSYIGELRPDLVNPASQYGAIATFDSELKQDMTPQEEGRIRQQLMSKYKNPDTVNQVVDRLREGIKNKYNEALAKYGFDKEKRQQIDKKWTDFTNNTPARLSPFLSKYGESFPQTRDILTNKYNQYAASQPVNLTPEQMHANAMKFLQRDMTKLDAYAAAPPMPPVRTASGVADYIEQNKESAKDLAELGYIEAVKEDAINTKDMGNEEFHSLMWGDQTDKNILNSLHENKAPKEYQGKSYNSKYPQEYERYIDSLSKKLSKMSPNDDLILQRAMVLDNGGTEKDFTAALSKAKKNGLELSPFQSSQLQETIIPRQPPLWEIFNTDNNSATQIPFGVIGNLGWRPFINYLRGKK